MTALRSPRILLLAALALSSAAEAQIRDPFIRTMSIAPTTVTVGGQFMLTASRVNYADRECRAVIGRDTLRTFAVVDGQISAPVTIPTSYVPAIVTVELLCQKPLDPSPTKLGEQTLKILRAIPLTLTPTSAAAGQTVSFSASGLVGSSFELWYGGTRVFGPSVLYRSTSVSGRFVVPATKSTTFPVAATVVARSLSGKIAPGRGSASFSQTAKPTYRTRFLSPTAPSTVDADRAITLTGRVEASDGTPQTRTVNAYWKGDDGRVVPLGRRDVAVGADGTFTLGADLPSESTQDGYYVRGTGRFVYTTTEIDEVSGRTVTTTHETGPVQSQPLQNFSDSARARIRVLKPNGTPLAEALVEVAGGATVLRDPTASSGTTAAFGPANQLQAIGGQQVNLDGCPLSLARGYTDANGYFEFLIDRNAAADYALQQVLTGALCEFSDGRGGDDQERCARNTAVDTTITVYTGHLGFGRIVNGIVEPYVIPAEFRLDENDLPASRFYNPETGIPYNQPGFAWTPTLSTSVVTPAIHAKLYRRRADATGFDTGSGAFEPYPLALDTVNNVTLSNVGKIFDLKSATPQGCGNPDTICVPPTGATFEISYLHDFILSGSLQTARLVICNGTDRYDCAAGGATVVNLVRVASLDHCDVAGYEHWSTALAPAQLVATNSRVRGRLELTSLYNGQTLTGTRPFAIGLDNLPSWFNGSEPELKNREVRMGLDGRASFFAIENMTGGGPHEIAISSSRLDDHGLDNNQRNATDNSRMLWVYQRNRDEAPAASTSDIQSTNEVANNDADATSVATGGGGVISRREIIFIDTGEVPLFRYVWGVPPIASATVGADFWLQAGMYYGGEVGADATAQAPPQVTFYTEPFMDLGIDVFFDLEILFGIVSAEVTASPSFSLAMKSSFAAGGYSPPSAGVDECAVFRLDLTWEVCAIFCEGDTENLFKLYEPESAYCQAKADGFIVSKGSTNYRARPQSAIAIDDTGYGAVFLVDDDKRFVAYEWNGGLESTQEPKPLDMVGDSVTSAASVMYGAGTGIAVWSKIPGSPASIETATRNSHLMYAKVLAGGAQYQPQTLTAIGSGDGNVAMASCPDSRPACPDGGEATAVWVRRIGSQYASHHYAVMYSRYRNDTGWSTPARIDSAQGAASDTQPTVVYRNATPLVVWVRKPTSGLANAETRRIAYRLLDGTSPVRVSTDLPGGVAWPSLSTRLRQSGSFSVLEVLLAYTVSTDPNGFLGNHNALHVARASCGGGTCAWTDETLRDTHGRTIMVERPTVIGSSSGDVAVSFRGLAFGRDANGNRFRAGDPPGMIAGSGETISIRPKLDGSRVSITAITADASGGVRPAFGFDPSIEAYVSVSQPGPEIPQNVIVRTKALTPNPIAKGAQMKLGSSVVIAQLGAGPDLGLTALTTTAPYLTPGTTVRINASVENFGDDYVPATDQNYTLVATWDGPEGSDDPALTQTLTSLASNGRRTLALDVPVPAGFRPDDTHTLFVTLRPDADVAEANAVDNERMISIGAMPIPTNLRITREPGQPIVFVNWTLDGPADPRVAGYRVMLVDALGNRKALGSTPVMGFADVAGAIGEPRSYVVTSYSANGVESAESAIVVAVPAPAPVVAGETTLLSDGFEGP